MRPAIKVDTSNETKSDNNAHPQDADSHPSVSSTHLFMLINSFLFYGLFRIINPSATNIDITQLVVELFLDCNYCHLKVDS